jgi:hypothetical protein
VKKQDNKELIQKFMTIFVGYELARGEHELFDKPDETGKLKGRAYTRVGGADYAHYERHLLGAGISLGLIPIMQNDVCMFAAVDIDTKGEVPLKETIEQLEGRIRKMDLPLVVCRSKSGGAHLYLFVSRPVPASEIQSKLSSYAALLGYGGCEIFPKQATRVDEGDKGNWINIAYYGALSKQGTDRYCVKNGKAIKDLEAFCEYAELMKVDFSDLRPPKIVLSRDFEDGPPCLQHLATIGIDQGGRNSALTNMAIYFKKKHPDDWQEMTMKFNYEKVKPALESGEVSQIIKNVSRKEYFYTCKVPPIVNHCDKKLCARRQFGITFGNNAELIQIDNITQCISKDSVRWYIESDGHRFQCQSDDLLSQSRWAKIMLEKFKKMHVNVKSADWSQYIQEKLDTASVVHDPEDASQEGQFENILENFFSHTPPARNRDELIKGNSFVEDGRVYFRSEDLLQFLRNKRFQHTPHEVWGWMKEKGADARQLRVKGKVLRLWTLPEPEKYDNTPIALPIDIEEEM